MLVQLQSRLANLNTRIDEITAEIAMLSAETGGSTQVMDTIAAQIVRLNSNKDNLIARRTNIQAQIDAYSAEWTSSEQTIVDEIETTFNSEYHTLIEEVLKISGTDRRTEFFTLYSGAINHCQKQCVIKAFFNL
jgi:septal ring factor EnvC (AmiA/AmiB activator)